MEKWSNSEEVHVKMRVVLQTSNVISYYIDDQGQGFEGSNCNFESDKINYDSISFFNSFLTHVQDVYTNGRISGKEDDELDKREQTYLEEHVAVCGYELFKKLLPLSLRTFFWCYYKKITHLEIISNEAWIPWEIMKLFGDSGDVRQEGRFFCETFIISKWLHDRPEPSRHLPMNNLLLINSGQSNYENYKLNPVYDLTDKKTILKSPDQSHIVENFSSGSYDLIHIIGHAHFEEKNPAFSKYYLGNNTYITPAFFNGRAKNMGKSKPFVFMNVCSSSRHTPALTDMGGWATSIIEANAGAFLGTHWDIPDKAASIFSHSLYRNLLDGRNLAESVFHARQATRRYDPMTWLSFSLFANISATRETNQELDTPTKISESHGHFDQSLGFSENKNAYLKPKYNLVFFIKIILLISFVAILLMLVSRINIKTFNPKTQHSQNTNEYWTLQLLLPSYMSNPETITVDQQGADIIEHLAIHSIIQIPATRATYNFQVQKGKRICQGEFIIRRDNQTINLCR